MANPIFPEMEAHLVLVCSHCASQIPLPTEKIRWLFYDPVSQPNDRDAAAVVCPRCWRIDKYTLHKRSEGYNRDNMVIPMRRLADVLFAEPLRCVEETCNTRLPLIAMWKPTATAKERKANIETWNWEGLVCPLGHRIEKPERLLWHQ